MTATSCRFATSARPAGGQAIPPTTLRRRLDQWLGKREEKQRRYRDLQQQLAELETRLELAQPVTDALMLLSEKLFEQELRIVEEKLTIALQDVLEQPVCFRARPDFKGGVAVVEFAIERNGHAEDVQRGQGGSVQNILSVGLRMFALATLGKANHRGFLVLDEQDCWLRPELVPRLVRIVRQAGEELGFQVLLISHHDLGRFDRYANRILKLERQGDSVEVVVVDEGPAVSD
jgi:DNA repair exonuclease SbcCD ATPase subunit